MESRGQIVAVGLGPGERELLTPQAFAALCQAEVVIGYAGYFTWVEDIVKSKECVALALGQEMERARLALEHAGKGRRVAVISSGDAGIYAMAGVVLEALEALPEDDRPDFGIVPGISALNAAAALLGAPLGHDFAVISLSDLLTPWEAIEKRLAAAASADFVLVLFNAKSQSRDWQLKRACEIVHGHRSGTTPVGIVRNAFRPGLNVHLTTLADLPASQVDMFSIVFVGNSTSRFVGKHILTPRGYPAEPR
jgi:precorrin-3B C17-methyltransferase